MKLQNPNIVFLDAYSLGDYDLSKIQALGNYTAYSTTSKDQIVVRAKDADIVITNKVAFDRKTLEALPRLRMIAIAATGMNHIDMEAAEELGITVKNAVGYSTHSVTETTIGGALALLRQIPYYDRFVKQEYATSTRQFHFGRPIHQLHGKHWGIIGLGNIGHEVAKVASALGCEIRYTSTSSVERAEPYTQLPLDELLSWADIVSIHCPLNKRTMNLIDKRAFEMMKPWAIIINVARGGIINEADLKDALNHHQIAGAVLDVFDNEPITQDCPLLQVEDKDRLILSPHNAWAAEESVKVLVQCMYDNIANFLK